MPHYKNGLPAKVGDYVKGTVDGREFVGTVIHIVESDACNCVVAHCDQKSTVLLNSTLSDEERRRGHSQIGWGVAVIPSTTYGTLKDFELIPCIRGNLDGKAKLLPQRMFGHQIFEIDGQHPDLSVHLTQVFGPNDEKTLEMNDIVEAKEGCRFSLTPPATF